MASPPREASSPLTASESAAALVEGLGATPSASLEPLEHLAELRATLSSMTDALVVYRPDGSWAFANPAARELLGLLEHQANAQRLEERAHASNVADEDGQPLDAAVTPAARALRGETVRSFLMRYRRLDGTELWLSVGAAPMVTAEGERIGAVAVFTDVSDRKRAEQRLREVEATLRGILNATNESVWLFAPDGTICMANQTALQRLGRRADEVIGRDFATLVPPDLVDSRRHALQRVVASRQPFTFEDARNGIDFVHRFYPVFDSAGAVTHVAAFSQDITERKRADEALRAANTELREVDQRKNDFLAVLSHELRNPLTPIRNSL